MLALCHLLALPARYVSGHLLGHGGTHAWVEVVIPHAGHAVAMPFDPWFRSTILGVDVLRSAARHRIPAEDIQHAVSNAVAVEEIADDPIRWLVLGPDRAGNLLELVVMDRPHGPAVIHAMPMRAKYRRLLPEGR